MDLNFDKLFKYLKLCLILNRTDPYIQRDKKWYIHVVIMFGFYLISLWVLVYCAILHDLKNKDYSEASYKGTMSIFAFLIILKYGVMVKYQKSILNLIEIIKDEYKYAEILTEKEKMTLMHYAIKGQWVLKLWLTLGVAGISIFLLKSVVLMIYYTTVNKFKFVPLIQAMTYPCAEEKTLNEWKSFIFMYLISLWYMSFGGCTYIGFASLVSIFITHACGQLDLIKLHTQELFQGHCYDAKETREKFKHIINHLHRVYSFVKHIEETFQIVFEIIFKAYCIAIPMTAYQLKETVVSGQLSIELIGPLIGMIAMPGSICYYGDLLIQTGENVREAIYMTVWEKHWDRSARATLLILLTRTMQPVAIHTMFRVVCLDTLADIYHQAYAIFNLMNASM